MHAQLRIERFLGGTVLDELDAAEESPAADVADMWVLAKRAAQLVLKKLPQGLHPREQAIVVQALLHRKRTCAGRGMADVGMAVLEKAAAAHNRSRNLFCNQNCADRLITGAQALGDRREVGDDTFLLERPER